MEINIPIVLGTVQLGVPYGIANVSGQPDQQSAEAIIQKAWELGIREFDTAQGYGIAEDVLGNALQNLGLSNEAKVISKFHPSLEHLDKKAMEEALINSLKKLHCSRLYGILLHRGEKLKEWNQGLFEIVNNFKKRGLVDHCGVSLDTPQDALIALATEGVELIQFPSNALDRRFEKIDAFKAAVQLKKSIYVRSVYLQGLLLMDEEKIPLWMQFAKPLVQKLENISKDLGLTRSELAIGYVKKRYPDAKIVLGVEKLDQIVTNVEIWKKEYPDNLVEAMLSNFPDVDTKILSPYLWPTE